MKERFVKITGHETPEIGDLLSSMFDGDVLVSVDRIAKGAGLTLREVIEALVGMEEKGFISLEWYVRDRTVHE